ncbi:MAG: DUF4301 family protein [Paludibacteraceae bacterium]|nr:DUF4301 family protein [Paludibacteraceae bacterium]
MYKLTQKDKEQLAQRGITEGQFATQVDNLEKGFPFVKLAAAAAVGNGIIAISEQGMQSYIDLYESRQDTLKTVKFVPASGAASRMFKDMVDYYLQEGKSGIPGALQCLQNLRKFAFYDKLASKLRKYDYRIGELEAEGKYVVLDDFILHDQGLNYQKQPKAMILFHQYGTESRTAFEEHLVEGASYARSGDGQVHLHFTISPEHRPLFEHKIHAVLGQYEERLGVKFNIEFSEQKPKTDMVALNKDGELVRNEDGSLLFRPGGHGSLIENLNEIDADLIFIKNIDNVTVDRLRETTVRYKKALAGYLLELQQEVFKHLNMLESLSISTTNLAIIEGFAVQRLGIKIGMDYYSQTFREKILFWQQKLNRPIRVCGMVRNEGEPGGGPYWVLDSRNQASLQVVEASQININDEYQKKIVAQSTHFNPVDLVCSTKNYKGGKFNLRNYIDHKTGFISSKKQNGIEMRIQERPGLWNGAMADWNTIFVEVPVETFTPVKMLSDLLRKEHQGAE